MELINFVRRRIHLAMAASLSLSRGVFILRDSFGRCDRLAAATSFRWTVKLWRFPAPLPGYNRLAAAASFPLSRKISRLCGSFGLRCNCLAAITSFRRTSEALILLDSVSRHNCLAAAAPFPLSRKVPRFFDSLCRRHCLSAVAPSKRNLQGFELCDSQSLQCDSRGWSCKLQVRENLKSRRPAFTNRMLSAATF